MQHEHTNRTRSLWQNQPSEQTIHFWQLTFLKKTKEFKWTEWMNVLVGSLKMETTKVPASTLSHLLRIPCECNGVFLRSAMFLTFSLRVIFLNPIKIELNSNKVQYKLNTESSSCRCKIRSRKCCTVNLASDSRKLASTIAFVQGIRFLNGYRRQMEVGLFIHYAGWMGSAGLGCLLYSCINVIYELANCLCPDRFHDQAGKVISCPISVVSIGGLSVTAERIFCWWYYCNKIVWFICQITAANPLRAGMLTAGNV